MQEAKMNEVKTETAVLGGGCFWCVEAIYERFDGVLAVESGYSAGQTENPTYRDVCTGKTGHAEVVRITFDPSVSSYRDIVDLFWEAHDPTTLNRQGNDVGTQYRSIILYLNEEQKKIAEASLADAQARIGKKIVTQIEAFKTFYPAEDYHQGYYDANTSAPYCAYVITPKLEKLRAKLKP